MTAVLGWLRGTIERHLAFLAVAALAAAVLFGVPQVFHIWWCQVPGLTSSRYNWLLGLFVVGLVYFNLAALWHVVARDATPTCCTRAFGVLQKLTWPLRLLDWLIALAGWLGPRGSLALGVAIVVTGGFAMVVGARSDGSRFYPLSGLACQSAGVLLALLGLWLAIPGRAPRATPVRVAAGRLLGWLAITSAFGEALWACAGPRGPDWGSYRLVTIWAVFELGTLLLMAAHVIDKAHAAWRAPVRPLALAVTVIAVAWWSSPQPLDPDDYRRDAPGPGPAAPARVADAWFRQFQARLDSIPADRGPVVLVAAGGGGSRAAAFTALTLEALARTPLPGEPRRSYADNIAVVSSVSGGSLAVAHYVQGIGPPPVAGPGAGAALPAARPDLRHTIKSDLEAYLAAHPWTDEFIAGSMQLAAAENQQERWPRRGDPRYADKLRALQEERRRISTQLPGQAIEDATRAIRRLTDIDLFFGSLDLDAAVGKTTPPPPAADDAAAPRDDDWPLASALFDDMCTDFMAPVLRGSLSATLDRGDGLARFWTQHFGWAGSAADRGYARAGGPAGYAPYHPVVLFDAAAVERGSRLAAGFPPLPPELWRAAYVSADDAARPERVGRPRSLSEVAPGLTLSLARAVRLSSNFPYGFRLARLPTADGVLVTDGGVVDNSGLDGLAELLTGLVVLAEGKSPNFKELAAPAKKALAALHDRGVLLVEIDTGAKPSEERVRGLASGLLEPWRGMTNAGYTSAELTGEQHHARIRAAVEPAPFQHYRFVCVKPGAAVMTAWALGTEDKGAVVHSFLRDWKLWTYKQPRLRAAFAPAVADRPNLRRVQDMFDGMADRKRQLEEKSRPPAKR